MNPLGPGDPLRLGPYRLTGVLGAGGMGQVYLGRDAAGRTAAVKVLRPELAHDPEMARRFLREAYAAQAVRSAGVARVLAAQTEGGRPWMATEFLVGPTLDQAVERYGALGEPAVRALGAALVSTLREIHGAGFVHRDLKPSNIVLTSRGPKIIDFGIARPEHGLTLTTTGQTLATPGYAAPEQVLGRRTGPAGDVFSLGVVLAYAAGGRSVYEGGHVAAVQYQVVHGEPELEAVPEGLRTLVVPCLAKEAADRPALEALAGRFAPPRGAGRIWRTGPLAEDIARREADSRRMATMPGDEESRPTRRRLLTTLVAGGAVLAAGGGAGAWWLLRDDEDAADGTRPWDAKPLAEYDEGTAPSPLWGPVDLGSLKLADRAVPVPLPVRDLVVVAVRDGRLRAYGVTDGKPRWTTSATGLRGRLLALRDEGVLATDADGVVRMLSAKDGTQLWKAEGADAAALLAVDDSAVYVVTRAGRVRAVDLDSHRSLWTAPGAVRSSANSPAAAAVADGRLVVYGASGEVVALDTTNGRTVWGPDKRGSTSLAPVIVGGTVYLGGRALTALTLSDGKEKWAKPAVGDSGCSAPTVRKGVVYAVDGTDLSARKADGGSDMWTLPFASQDHSLDAPVAVGNSVWAVADTEGTGGVQAGGRPAREGGVAVHRGHRRQLAAGRGREPRLPAAQPDADGHAGVLEGPGRPVRYPPASRPQPRGHPRLIDSPPHRRDHSETPLDSDALDAYIRARLALAGVDIDQLPDVADPETGTPTRAVIMVALREFVATTPGALAEWTPPTGGVGGALGAAYAQQEAAPLAYPSITTAWTGEVDG